MSSGYVTTAVAAERLGVSQRLIIKLIHSGTLKATNVNPTAKRATYRICRDSLLQLEKALQIEPSESKSEK